MDEDPVPYDGANRLSRMEIVDFLNRVTIKAPSFGEHVFIHAIEEAIQVVQHLPPNAWNQYRKTPSGGELVIASYRETPLMHDLKNEYTLRRWVASLIGACGAHEWLEWTLLDDEQLWNPHRDGETSVQLSYSSAGIAP